MAHSGFCSNEQIIKAIKKKFKLVDFFLVSPEMLFLEEFYIFLEESGAMDVISDPLETGKQKYKELSISEKMRYVKLAEQINNFDFDE